MRAPQRGEGMAGLRRRAEGEDVVERATGWLRGRCVDRPLVSVFVVEYGGTV